MSGSRTPGGHDVERALQRGLDAQLEIWRREVQAPGRCLGWKIGFQDRASQQRLGLAHPLIGFLRSDRRLPDGAALHVPAGAIVKAEVEVAIRVGRDVPAGGDIETAEAAIAALAPAVEIVDVTRPLDGLEALLRGNLYHAAVAIGAERPGSLANPRSALHARLRTADGRVLASAPPRLPECFGVPVRVVADLLGAHGERLRAGDWIIGGSIIEPLTVRAGIGIDVDMPPLGRLTLDFSGA